MRNWFLKTFFRSKIARVLVYDDTRRLHDSYEFVKDRETINLHKLGLTFKINHEAVLFSTKDNIPTFVVNINNAECIDLAIFPKSTMSMDEFYLAINEAQAEPIIKHTRKRSALADVNLINLVFIICAMFLLGYYVNSRITELENKIFPTDPAPIVDTVPENNDEVGFGG